MQSELEILKEELEKEVWFLIDNSIDEKRKLFWMNNFKIYPELNSMNYYCQWNSLLSLPTTLYLPMLMVRIIRPRSVEITSMLFWYCRDASTISIISSFSSTAAR